MKKTIFFGLLTVVILIFASCIPLDDLPDFGDGDWSPSQDTLIGTWDLSFDFGSDVKSDRLDFHDALEVNLTLSEDTSSSYKLVGTVNSYTPDYLYATENVSFDSFTILSDGSISMILTTSFNDGSNEDTYTFELSGEATNLINSNLNNMTGSFSVTPDITDPDKTSIYLVPQSWSATRTSN
jgi:hypothetical protein